MTMNIKLGARLVRQWDDRRAVVARVDQLPSGYKAITVWDINGYTIHNDVDFRKHYKLVPISKWRPTVLSNVKYLPFILFLSYWLAAVLLHFSLSIVINGIDSGLSWQAGLALYVPALLLAVGLMGRKIYREQRWYRHVENTVTPSHSAECIAADAQLRLIKIKKDSAELIVRQFEQSKFQNVLPPGGVQVKSMEQVQQKLSALSLPPSETHAEWLAELAKLDAEHSEALASATAVFESCPSPEHVTIKEQ